MGYRSKIHLKIQKYRRRILEYKQKPCNYGFLFPQLHGLLYFNSLPDLLRKQHHNLITSLYKRCHLFRIQWLMCQHCQIIQLYSRCPYDQLHTEPADDLHSGSVYLLYPYPFRSCRTSSSFPAYGGSLQIMSS